MSFSDRILLLLATGFGLGRSPWAPGTFGSLWGIPIGWALWTCETTWWMRLLVAALMFVAGVPICSAGCRLLKRKDAPSVVWDEMAAFPIVFAFVDLSWWILIAGFVVFRFFDILKPWPIKHFERLPDGLGVMIDDTIAAVFSALVIYVSWVLFVAEKATA